MAAQAQVTSVEALESFRASLIVYVSNARPALEAVGAEVARTRNWLQTGQRIHWENQVRQRTRQLQDAQQALFSAQLARLREATDAEQMAVHKAKRALEQAEAKLRIVKRWGRDFDSRVGPPAKQLDHLRDLLTNDLPRAAVFLAQAVQTLDAYTGIAPASRGVEAAPQPARDVAKGSDAAPDLDDAPLPDAEPTRAPSGEGA
jgi:hypothetical protein